MLKKGIFPGCNVIVGTNNLYRHPRWPGLIFAAVDTVSQAIALGGVMIHDSASNHYTGAVGSDVKHLLSRTASKMGGQAYPFNDWPATVTTESLLETYNIVLESRKYNTSWTSRKRLSSSLTAAMVKRVPMESFFNIAEAEAANAMFMAIVTKAEFGWFRTGHFTSPNNDGAATAVMLTWAPNERVSLGYMGSYMNLGYVKDVLTIEGDKLFDCPAELKGAFAAARKDCMTRVDPNQIFRLPVIATWRAPRYQRPASTATLSVGLYDPLRCLYNATSSTSADTQTAYEAYVYNTRDPNVVLGTSVSGQAFMNALIPNDNEPQFFSDIAVNTPTFTDAQVKLRNVFFDICGEMLIDTALQTDGTFTRPLAVPGERSLPYEDCVRAIFPADHWSVGSSAGKQLWIDGLYAAEMAKPLAQQNPSIARPNLSGSYASSGLLKVVQQSGRMTGTSSDIMKFIDDVHKKVEDAHASS